MRSADCQPSELAALMAKREEEIRVLTEINRRLKGHFKLDSLLKEIMNYTRNMLECEACSLLLVDEDTEQLFFYVTDDSGANLDEIFLNKGQGVVGRVVETGEHLIVNDTSTSSEFFAGVDDKTGFQTRSLACVPMSVEERVIGAVEVLNKISGEFTDVDVDRLEVIASQSALAVEYVRANQKRSMNERMAVVGNMAAAVIHDLCNSMQIISGFSQLIAMQQPEQSENCEIIHLEIDKLIQMSQELLEFSRGSTISLNPADVKLSDFVRSIFQINQNSMEKEDVDFVLDVKDEVSVHMDATKMQRVIQNIISNAWQALEQNRHILLETGQEGQRAYVRVTDTGKGMDDDILKNIFKPFFTRGKKGGTGLGMAIVENIVKGHCGEILVSSEVGKGSIFTIYLPLSKQ